MAPALTAQYLRAAAAALRAAAAGARATGRDWAAEDSALAVGVAGGPAAGVARLAETSPAVAEAAAQMTAVASVLDVSASLHERLIGWEGPLAHLADAFGEVLDRRCAEEVTALCTPPAGPPGRRLGDLGGLSPDAVHELQLTENPRLAPLFDGGEARLLEAGPDGVVAVVGDLDSAETTLTFVAGVGSSRPESWPGYLGRARELNQATGAATVMWLGYRAPATLTGAVAREPAVHGAADLRTFQASLAARNPGQRRVVLGHSYGSVVASRAARDPHPPLEADALVLVGSPGVDAKNAGELSLAGAGGVHAITSKADPIGLTVDDRAGVHGRDPTSPGFGARVWHAGRGVDHSGYWEDPVTLAALAAITRGPGDSTGVYAPRGST